MIAVLHHIKIEMDALAAPLHALTISAVCIGVDPANGASIFLRLLARFIGLPVSRVHSRRRFILFLRGSHRVSVLIVVLVVFALIFAFSRDVLSPFLQTRLAGMLR